MFEHITRYTSKPKGSSDRFFGLLFSAVFAAIGLHPFLVGEAIRLWTLTIAASLLFIAIFTPNFLSLPNRTWAKFGIFLHQIVSPLALGVVFYGTVLPISLLMRLLGKDTLSLQFDKSTPSYWIKRDPVGQTPESLKNQF